MNQIVDTLDKQESLQDETKAQPSGAGPVVVAVELSESSKAALRWACGYAEAVGAPLEILHVVHDPGDSPGTYSPDGNDLLEPMADVAMCHLTGVFITALEHGWGQKRFATWRDSVR